MDLGQRRHHIPVVDRQSNTPPPILVAVVGPGKVGKSTLIRCLIKNFSSERLANILGPITVVAGRKRRMTFIECTNDINMMIDVAKVADLVCVFLYENQY